MPTPNATIVEELTGHLTDARARTLALVSDLSDEQLLGPRLPILNPLRWEIGHVAWFQERWLLRRNGSPSIRPDADSLYDSSRVAHDTRWDLPLPSRSETLAYMQAVLEGVLERLRSREPGPDAIYFHRMVTFHEDMHGEAFTTARQTLGYPPPRFDYAPQGPPAHPPLGEPPSGDAEIPGGTFLLGGTRDLPFVWDNEKWAHPVEVRPFRIGRFAVTQADFAGFVEDGGYRSPSLWSAAGWEWRASVNAECPVYWRREAGGGWQRRHFDAWVPLEPHLPVIHVNWYEAEAYCHWARRRLPTEAEWELSASAEPGPAGRGITERKRWFPWGNDPPTPEKAHLDSRRLGCVEVGALPAGDSAFGCRLMIGNAWEWTASDFGPFAGFVVDPYKEYSQPWFGGDYKVLRGGCWATRSRLIRNTWRNFYTPDRRDVFAGLRTCSL